MYQVVSPFFDRRSGKQINPGDPLPKGLTPDRARQLARAGCLKPAPQARVAGAKTVQTGAGEGGGAAPGSFPEDEAAVGTAPVAGGDGGAPGEWPEFDGRRGFFRQGSGKGDSG